MTLFEINEDSPYWLSYEVLLENLQRSGVLVPVEPDSIDQPRVRQAILGALLSQIEAGGGIECALLADAAIAAILRVGEETP